MSKEASKWMHLGGSNHGAHSRHLYAVLHVAKALVELAGAVAVVVHAANILQTGRGGARRQAGREAGAVTTHIQGGKQLQG
jgi:hypothetical protein